MARLRLDPNDPSPPIPAASDAGYLSEGKIDEYWELVKRTATDVFGEDPWQSQAKIQDLRRRLADTPQVDPRFWYHIDPLQVAADLTDNGNRPLTAAQRSKYIKIRTETLGEPPGSDAAGRRVPDDFNE